MVRTTCALLFASAFALGMAGPSAGQDHHFGNDRGQPAAKVLPGQCRCGVPCKCAVDRLRPDGAPFVMPAEAKDFIAAWQGVPARLEAAFWGAGMFVGAVGGLAAGLFLGVTLAYGRKHQ